jgi:hypothetical protein
LIGVPSVFHPPLKQISPAIEKMRSPKRLITAEIAGIIRGAFDCSHPGGK